MGKSNKIGRWVAAVLAIVALGVGLRNVVTDNMSKGEAQLVEGYTPWDPETIETLESLVVQDGGRLKPLSTYAGFQMLAVHGARSMKVKDGKGVIYKLKPTEWLMDSLFRPHLAINLPTFRVDNSDVLKGAEIEAKGRRDRYSYLDLSEGHERLMELALSFEKIEKDDRDPVHQQTIDLAYSITNYEALLGYFSFARDGITLVDSGLNGAPDKRVDFSAMMTAAPELQKQLRGFKEADQPIEPRLQSVLQQVINASNFARYRLFLLPTGDGEKWLPAGEAIMNTMSEKSTNPEMAIGDIRALETAVRSLAISQAAFREKFQVFKDLIEPRIGSEKVVSHIEMEVNYFKRNYFLNAMVLFLLGTLTALLMWAITSPSVSKILYWITAGLTGAAVIMCVIAIVLRSVIMQRPPVGNLYDTIIFIAATGVIFAFLIEFMSRKRFALGLAPMLGAALIILARRFEMGDASDHLDPLVAVLDSNYWLTTHVITITLGYSAGLLAAFLSCVYVLMRGLNLDGENKELRRSLTQAVYGSICLTVFLSLVGTVLGGIWANDSWGRFWGWDPKENGALMIVLWTLAILHARIGGLIKDWGIHLASIFTACVVTFSWWHVNFLGVGLHNYGFTAGKDAIWVFYSVMMAFVAFGFVVMIYDKQRKETVKALPLADKA